MLSYRRKSSCAVRTIEFLELRRLLAVVTVTNNVDEVNGDVASLSALVSNDGGDGISLREAVEATNASAGQDEIEFDFGHDGPETIALAGKGLVVSDALSIVGQGMDLLTIEGDEAYRIFIIDDGAANEAIAVDFQGLTISGGMVAGGPTSPPADRYGGGLFNAEDLRLTDVAFLGNSAESGGGIFNQGDLRLTDGLYVENYAGPNGVGGAVFNVGSLDVVSSRFESNSAYNGGAIFTAGEMTATDSFFVENTGWSGGAIASFGPSRLMESHFVGNQSMDSGSAVFSLEELAIIRSSISQGETTFRGGSIVSRGAMTMEDSEVADNLSLGSSPGIVNYGDAVIKRSNIVRNVGSGQGGGIANYGDLVIEESIVSDNEIRFGQGGGIASTGELTVVSSRVNGNSAQEGGGIAALGSAMVFSSTVAGNSASARGGGIFFGGGFEPPTSTVLNSTISGNVADESGGGIFSFGSVFVTQSTIAANSAAMGGGVFAGGRGVTTFANSILADNEGQDATYAADFPSILGATIVADGSLTGDFLLNVDPLLGPLTDEGGANGLHALSPGSPAIDAGDRSLAVNAGGEVMQWDQRGEGFLRILGPCVDLGAVESSGFIPGDATGDGVVNLDDFVVLKSSLNLRGDVDSGDFNGDELIDLSDFAILKGNFGRAAESSFSTDAMRQVEANSNFSEIVLAAALEAESSRDESQMSDWIGSV